MRNIPTLLAGAVGLAFAAGAASGQAAEGSVKSWGDKTKTYWSSESTGRFETGAFMNPTVMPSATTPAVQPADRQMYYQAPAKRTRLRQRQPATRPDQPRTGQGTAPPAKGTQPK